MRKNFLLKVILLVIVCTYWFSYPTHARVVRDIVVLERIAEAVEDDNVGLTQELIHAARPMKYEEQWQLALGHLGTKGWKTYVYRSLAITYFNIGDFEKTVEFDLKAGEEFLRLGRKREAVRRFVGAAINALRLLKDHRRSVKYNVKSAEICAEIGMHKEAATKYTIAATMSAVYLKDRQMALEYTVEAARCYFKAEMHKEASEKYGIAIAIAADKLRDYAKADELRAEFAECYGKPEVSNKADLAQVYEERGWFKKAAYLYMEVASDFQDKGKIQDAKDYYYKAAWAFEEARMPYRSKECYEIIEELELLRR